MNNNLFNFTPEMQLLVACCGVSMKQDEQEREESYGRLSAIRSQEDIDWEAFIDLVARHRIHSIACRNINQFAAEHIRSHASVAQNIRLALSDHSDQKRRQMLIRTTELVRLSKLFAQHGIFMLSFKGPLLSLHPLFGDFGRRYSKVR